MFMHGHVYKRKSSHTPDPDRRTERNAIEKDVLDFAIYHFLLLTNN